METIGLTNLSQKHCDHTASHGVCGARKGKTPAPSEPQRKENSNSFNNCGAGQNLLLSVKKALAQSPQLTALNSIHSCH